MSIQQVAYLPSSETSTNRWCRKRKQPSEASSAPSLFSSTTPRRRWVDSLKSAGTRLQSKVSAQAATIHSLWSPQAPVAGLAERLPSVPASFSILSVNTFTPEKINEPNRKLIELLKNPEMDPGDVEKELVRLIAAGADPFKKDSEGLCALDYAILYEDLKLLKILTQTISHPAFDSCKDIHDFFSLLFPPSRDCFPPNWERYVKKIPKSAELVEFEAEAIRLKETKRLPKLTFTPDELEQILFKSDRKNLLQIIKENLLQKSLLFRAAWTLANRPETVTFSEGPEEEFSGRSHSPGQGAHYDPATHSITINQNAPLKSKIEDLIFETFNALQVSIAKAWLDTPREREESVFGREWIEITTRQWTDIVYNPDIQLFSIDRKQQIWKKMNATRIVGIPSHAEVQRQDWDCSHDHSIRFLEKNLGFLKQRLAELEKDSPAIERDDFKGDEK